MKVYVLTSGSHEDYTIRAVCRTDERAKALILEARAKGEYWAEERFEEFDIRVEEFELDKLDYFLTPTLEGK